MIVVKQCYKNIKNVRSYCIASYIIPENSVFGDFKYSLIINGSFNETVPLDLCVRVKSPVVKRKNTIHQIVRIPIILHLSLKKEQQFYKKPNDYSTEIYIIFFRLVTVQF